MVSFKTLFVLVALVFAVSVSAQDVDLEDFDLFLTDLTIAPIITDDSFSTANPLTSTGSALDSEVVGGERDIAIVAEEGDANQVLHSGVNNAVWTASAPPGVTGFGLMQYDGVDGVTQLDGPATNGLQGYDATLAGGGTALHVILQSDLATSYIFTFYDSNNQVSTFTQPIPGDSTFHDYFITYNSLSGSANLASLGALEVQVELDQPVDALMQGFFISGPATVPVPSIPPVPTQAPAPSPNGFTWYTFDDDDEGRSPCGDEPDRRSYFLSDDNIVYYYFFGFDFTTQEASSSDAATVALSTAAAVVGVAAAVL